MILSVKVWENSHWTQLWTNDLGKFQNHTIWEGTHNLAGHLSLSISSNEKLDWSHPGWSLDFRRGWWETQGSSFSEGSAPVTLTSPAQTGDTPDSGSAFFSFIFSSHLLSFVSSLSTSDSTAVSRNNSRQRQVFTHVWVMRVSCSGKQVTPVFFLARRCSPVVGNSLRCLFFFFLFHSFSQSEFVGVAGEYSVLWREWVCSKLVDVSLQLDAQMSGTRLL